jgi:hypothetical protein
VKLGYFSQLIKDMKALLDNVRSIRHRKKPFYTNSARRLSFKVYDLCNVQSALENQSLVKLKTKVLFSSGSEVIQTVTDARSALAAAKQKAFIRRTQRAAACQIPSDRCSLVIDEVKGRISRELELIWWPNLYQISGLGKLDIRFYVEKTVI